MVSKEVRRFISGSLNLKFIFHILKVGTVHNYQYKNYEELESAITNYVYYYNQRRIKTKVAGMSPVKYREHTSHLAA
ncbi:IS3 family transposase [Lactiplantibacillus plantarum]|jgi:hypothetical protein|uniref:IS3 family transposase n=1 Tax=Lactiplantibacillus plantarum TaxID=1590 RepID=UPI003983747E